ncbi:MAG: hypothetical protein ACI901_000432 [Octadecabacter sp.]|jgi:hypothetical protein
MWAGGMSSRSPFERHGPTCNAHTIANRMATQLLDLLALLFEPISIDQRCEVPNCTKQIMHIHVLKGVKAI